MACKNICKLCNRLNISTAVTFTGGNLVITIPAGGYDDGSKYCIVVAQPIPATATIDAPVVIQIGTGTVQYPVTRCDCSQATACNIKTRTKYSTCLHTTPTGGTFRLLGNVCNCGTNNLRTITGAAPTTAVTAVSAPVE